MLDQRSNSDQFTDRELRWSYWYLTNRFLLGALTFVTIVLIDVILFSVFAYKTYDVFRFDDRGSFGFLAGAHTQLASLNIGNVSPIQDLRILDTWSFPSSGGFDMTARLGNVNAGHIGYVLYRFNANGHSTPWRSIFVFPQKESYVHELGYKDFSDMSNATIEFFDPQWRSVNRFEEFYSERFNFAIEDINFVNAIENPAGNEVGGKVVFKATNKTSFDYKKIDFSVLLYSGTSLSQVNKISLNDFDSGKVYEMELPFYGEFNAGWRVEVVPNVNILDSHAYKKI